MIKEFLLIASILQMTSLNVRDWGMAGQYNNNSLQNTSILLFKIKMFKIKPGVKIAGVKPPMILAAIAANSFCSDINKECVITSAIDGKHKPKSKHYSGNALDFRTKNFTKAQQKMFAVAMKESLGDSFDVILEKNHLHIEYDPIKKYENFIYRY